MLLESASDYAVKPVSFTDHCLVKISLGKKKKRTPKFNWGLWKFNDNLLKDEEFLRRANIEVNNIVECEGVSLFEKWEYFKEEIKQIAIERSCA